MWHSKWFTYAQCWSQHSETDAMWRCYSYGNRAIRIRTRDEYFHKRPAFRHEGEYRLLIVDRSLYFAEGFSSFGVKFKIEEQVKNKTDEEILRMD